MVAAVACGLNYWGFCWHERSILTPERKIDAAILRVIARYPPVLEAFYRTGQGTGVVSYRRPQRPINYRDIADFKRINPNCCALVVRGREGWRPSFIQRITGAVSALVQVKYEVRYESDHGVVSTTPHETFVPISNCGVAQDF